MASRISWCSIVLLALAGCHLKEEMTIEKNKTPPCQCPCPSPCPPEVKK